MEPFHTLHRGIQFDLEAVFFLLQVIQIPPADTDAVLANALNRPPPVFILVVFLCHQFPDQVFIITQIYHIEILLVFGVTELTLEHPKRQGSPAKKARFRAFFFWNISRSFWLRDTSPAAFPTDRQHRRRPPPSPQGTGSNRAPSRPRCPR